MEFQIVLMIDLSDDKMKATLKIGVMKMKNSVKKLMTAVLSTVMVFVMMSPLTADKAAASEDYAQITEIDVQNDESLWPMRDFVGRLYSCVLDRQPEIDGTLYWMNQLYSFRQSGAEVAEGFIFSEEFKARNTNDTEFLTILYKTFFNREPDDEGMKFWKSKMFWYTTREEVAQGFIYSQEWADTCAEYGIRSGGDIKPTIELKPTELTNAFVERMYTTALKRDFDAEGRDYWAVKLANFDETGESVGVSFFLSKEMRNSKLSDEEFINRLYLTFMDREADEEGIDYWKSFLKKKGNTRSDVVYGFTRSPEFEAKCIEARILPY